MTLELVDQHSGCSETGGHTHGKLCANFGTQSVHNESEKDSSKRKLKAEFWKYKNSDFILCLNFALNPLNGWWKTRRRRRKSFISSQALARLSDRLKKMETDFIPCRPEFLTKDWIMMVLNQYRSLKDQSLIRWSLDDSDFDSWDKHNSWRAITGHWWRWHKTGSWWSWTNTGNSQNVTFTF